MPLLLRAAQTACQSSLFQLIHQQPSPAISFNCETVDCHLRLTLPPKQIKRCQRAHRSGHCTDLNQLDTAEHRGRREPLAFFASFALREQEINFQEGPEALLDVEHMHALRTDARALPHNLAQRWRPEKWPVQLLRSLSPHAWAKVPRADERWNSLGSTGHFSEHPLPALQMVQGQGGGFLLK